MNKHRITSDERAVSGLVGEILLIGIAIVAIGLIAVSVYSYLNKDPETPHLEVTGMANMGTNEIHIKHQGGDPIECENLRVLVNVPGPLLDPYDDDSPDRWGLSDEGIGNFDQWTLGNILVLDTMPEVNITDDDEIRVTIVSLSSSRVVVSGEVFGGLFGNASINRKPIADAGDDQTNGLCENNTKWKEVWVWFNGSGSYDPDNPDDYTGDNYRGIVSWHWDFDDGNTSDKMWGWHNYSVNGTYYVTLTVTDVDGATDNDTCIITILPPENLTADAGPDQWVGIGAEVRLNGSGSTGCIKEWKWEFGDGTNATVNASTTTHVYSKEGDYIVNLTVVEDYTNNTANDSAIIHVMSGFKIVKPPDGAVFIDVSDPVTIDARAFGIEEDYVNFNISHASNEVSYSHNATNNSGKAVAHNTTSYTYNWSITGIECGNYTINATAYNTEDVEMGTDNITVCVCNVPNLMGFWRFDDGAGSRAANDSSCNRNHGSIYGDPIWIIDDTLYPPLYALRFNGSSDYVEVANSTSLAMTNKTTIGVWANSSDAGEQYILAKGDMVFELNITTAPSTYTDRISMPDPDNFKYLVYYAWLNSTNLDIDWAESGLELVMVADSNESEIRAVQDAGVKVYYYIALGRSYNDSDDKAEWYANITDEMTAHNYTNGFVWDELDPGYFNSSYHPYTGTGNKDEFDAYLEQLNAHAHNNLSKKTVANGVRYYATHCDSDYYMWESFMSSYHGSVSSPDYYYWDFFNTMWMGDNANISINGIKKYEYLRDNGVLNKTLVHSFGEPDDDNKSIYDYIASRVMGLKGFSYADSTNFVSENATVAEGLKWDLGTRMSYDIDADAGNLSGRFTNGAVVDCVNQTVAANNNAIYTTDLISDPLTAHLLNSSSRVTGLDLCLIRGQVDFMHGVLRSSTDLTEWDPGYHAIYATLDAESGAAALYINYTLAAERTFPMGLPFDFTGSNLTIGANNTGDYGFNGYIEEVKIYNR